MPELKRFLTGSIAREEYGDRLRVHLCVIAAMLNGTANNGHAMIDCS